MPNRRTSKNIAHRARRRKRKELRRIEFLMMNDGVFVETLTIVDVLDATNAESLDPMWMVYVDGEDLPYPLSSRLCVTPPKVGERLSLYCVGSRPNRQILGCKIEGRTYITHPDLPFVERLLGIAS